MERRGKGYLMVSNEGNRIIGTKVEVRVYKDEEFQHTTAAKTPYVAYVKLLAEPNTVPNDVEQVTKCSLEDLPKFLQRQYYQLEVHKERREGQLAVLEQEERVIRDAMRDAEEYLEKLRADINRIHERRREVRQRHV